MKNFLYWCCFLNVFFYNCGFFNFFGSCFSLEAVDTDNDLKNIQKQGELDYKYGMDVAPGTFQYDKVVLEILSRMSELGIPESSIQLIDFDEMISCRYCTMQELLEILKKNLTKETLKKIMNFLTWKSRKLALESFNKSSFQDDFIHKQRVVDSEFSILSSLMKKSAIVASYWPFPVYSVEYQRCLHSIIDLMFELDQSLLLHVCSVIFDRNTFRKIKNGSIAVDISQCKNYVASFDFDESVLQQIKYGIIERRSNEKFEHRRFNFKYLKNYVKRCKNFHINVDINLQKFKSYLLKVHGSAEEFSVKDLKNWNLLSCDFNELLKYLKKAINYSGFRGRMFNLKDLEDCLLDALKYGESIDWMKFLLFPAVQECIVNDGNLSFSTHSNMAKQDVRLNRSIRFNCEPIHHVHSIKRYV